MTEPSSKFRISENAWLTTIPVVATYLVFLFQSIYFSYFGVPVSMVDVDVPKIIFSTAALALAAVFLIVLFAAVADLLSSQNPVVQIVGKGLTGVVIFLPLILASKSVFTTAQLTTYGIIFFGLWLTNFWPPARKEGESKSYIERLRAQEEAYTKAIKSEPRNIKQAVGTNVLGPFSILFFLSIYVMMLGTYCASVFGGGTYLRENPDALYVGRTGGAYIFTIVDPETNTFGKEVLLKDAGSTIELIRSERKARRE
ncbi:hypothetical protein [Luteimonas terrae]|uniref:Uncharacterized protein n=1 Tax=Luteimonas terrae TaxID=1530191 RepID=A0ABU1XXD9_9GAMM|nr:hypothetical protein [Luteimonas terrae]MDR7193439.1 hypothetical protein [Luteimonas terrae]